MKLLLIVTTLYYVSINPTFGGCFTGTTDADDRRLGIETTNTAGSQSDAKFFANIYSGGSWDGWRRLDNQNCDDFTLGAVDYFDDFESITGEWEAIAFYNCGSDGLRIESVYYWDGSNERQCIVWRPGVFGPFGTKCLYTNAVQADPENPSTSWYSDILVDGDHFGESCCSGVVFETGTIGSVWTGTLPGIPDCSNTEFGQVPAVYPHRDIRPLEPVNDYRYGVSTDFEQQLLNYLMGAIGIVVLLFVSNSCLITAMVRNSNKPNAYYGKVKSYDSEA